MLIGTLVCLVCVLFVCTLTLAALLREQNEQLRQLLDQLGIGRHRR